ncbi:uncharacterized protein V3H82_026610 isoform 2-T3 [Fundulus diaphanus]
MTPPKSHLCCPLCHCVFTYLGKHLRRAHGLQNQDECKILINYANGRINIRSMPCPFDGCDYLSSRLDRHIELAHPEVEVERISEAISTLKYQATIQRLKALRETNPDPPMLSCLEIGMEQEMEHVQLVLPKAEVVPEDPSSSSCTSCSELISKNVKLTNELGDLRKKLRFQHRWARRARRAINRLQEALEKSPSGPVEPTDLDALGDEGQHGSSSDEEARPSKPKPNPAKRTSLSVLQQYPKFPPSILQYIEDYWVHLKSCTGQKKHLENQKSKLGRIMNFLTFMTEGRTILQNWMFLPNIKRVNQWPELLLNEGLVETTVRAYLINLSQFLGFFRDTPPSASKVPKTAVFSVIRAVSACITKLRTPVVIRQIRIKKMKMSKAIPREHLHLCKVLARARIPEILDELSNDPKPQTRRTFFGYLSVYIASLYGHRTGVLKNMTVAEVDEAQMEAKPGDAGFVINVKEHKTNRAFGPAQLYLTLEEFSWLEQWLIIRGKINPSSDLVFFTEKNTRVEKLICQMQTAWADMGLPGIPTFTDFRTSIATYARNVLSPASRAKVLKTMCHDTRTAEYYALHLTAPQLAEIRDDFELAIKPSHLMSSVTDESPLLTLKSNRRGS